MTFARQQGKDDVYEGNTPERNTPERNTPSEGQAPRETPPTYLQMRRRALALGLTPQETNRALFYTARHSNPVAYETRPFVLTPSQYSSEAWKALLSSTAPEQPNPVASPHGRRTAESEVSQPQPHVERVPLRTIADLPAYIQQELKPSGQLQGADLHGANLILTSLTGADLSGADLHGARLQGAYLLWADLSGANLSGADLRGTNLNGTSLSGADLQGADLRRADLRGAFLDEGTTLDRADLRGALLDAGTKRAARAQGAITDPDPDEA